MNNEERIAAKLIVQTLLDKEQHDIYEFHKKYRISPLMLLKSLEYLEHNNIVHINESKVLINIDMNNKSVAIINSLTKTKKPEKLNKIRLDNQH